MFKKVLIANRGEIAVRIIRTCKEMGIETVAVYSKADSEALHVQLADQAICIGEAKASDSYLNIPNILSAASMSGCDAIHPGFGFLSENPQFARQVQQCNMTFIGPSADVIELMGDKAQARDTMLKAGIQTIPGSDGCIDTLEEGIAFANKIGYPVLIKAASGGGGRGMRIAFSEDEFTQAYLGAKSEAKTAFGDDSVYIEKYLNKPKHIEVQLLADHFGNVLHLFERDCSMQRRNQKVLEEAPCFTLSQKLRDQLYETAVRACKAVNYDSVGTIEFLVDDQENYYFMEMNTRIQVEHTISEEICNIDLIKMQIKVAANQPLKLKQEDIQQRGFAIECRINAENIKQNFAPTPGKITFLNLPGGRGVRIDSAVYNGYTIPPYYDSMIAKLITSGDTRMECIKKMRIALEEFIIEGIPSNIEFQYLLLHQKSFIEGKYTTKTIDEFVKELEENGTVI